MFIYTTVISINPCDVKYLYKYGYILTKMTDKQFCFNFACLQYSLVWNSKVTSECNPLINLSSVTQKQVLRMLPTVFEKKAENYFKATTGGL